MKKALPIMLSALLFVSGCALNPLAKIKRSFNAATTTLTDTLNPNNEVFDENGNRIERVTVTHQPVEPVLTKEQKLLRRAGVVLGEQKTHDPIAYQARH